MLKRLSITAVIQPCQSDFLMILIGYYDWIFMIPFTILPLCNLRSCERKTVFRKRLMEGNTAKRRTKNESHGNIIHSEAFHAGRKRPGYKSFFRYETWPDDNGETNGFSQGDCLDCPFHYHLPDIGATELNRIYINQKRKNQSCN